MLLMALRKYLILGHLAKRGLEGRRIFFQPCAGNETPVSAAKCNPKIPTGSRRSSKTNSNAVDVVFILKAIQRFAAMSFEEIRLLSKHDLVSALPHPSGHGQLFCGQAAAERIEELADRYLAGHPLSGRLDPKEVVDRLGEEIVRRFLAEGKQVNEQQVAQVLASRSDPSLGPPARLRVAFRVYYISGASERCEPLQMSKSL